MSRYTSLERVAAGRELESEAKLPIPAVRPDQTGGFGFGARDPLGLAAHVPDLSEAADGFRFPALDRGRRLRPPQVRGEKRRGALVATLRNVVEEMLDDRARSFGHGAPPHAGHRQEKRDRRERHCRDAQDSSHAPGNEQAVCRAGPEAFRPPCA